MSIRALNDNKTFDADRSIQTSFAAGTTLVELTGNPGATNPLVVQANGRATVKIPHDGNDQGYAIWGPKAPRGSTSVEPLSISPVASVMPPDVAEVPNGRPPHAHRKDHGRFRNLDIDPRRREP